MAVTVAVGTNLVYAPVHEFGAVITPKTATRLHFVVDGEDVFAKRVVIPARPYMRPAFDHGREPAMKVAAQVIGEVITRMASGG